MTDDEALSAYNELLSMLRGLRLEWVAQQVGREIAEGKPIREPLRTVRIGPFDAEARSRSRARKAEYTRVIPYDPKSMLIKLIDSIETVVVSSTSIATHLSHFISPGQPFTVNFRGETPDDISFGISEADLTVTVPAADALRALLIELKQEAERAD